MIFSSRDHTRLKKMNIYIIPLLFLPKIWATSESNATTIHMNEVSFVPVSIYGFSNSTVQAKSWDENIVKVDIESYKWLNDLKLVNVTLRITGVFLGTSKISVYSKSIEDGDSMEKVYKIIVIREERLIDKIFTGSVATLVSILYINFGCAMDWGVCKKTLKNPIGPVIGSLSQFIYMPLVNTRSWANSVGMLKNPIGALFHQLYSQQLSYALGYFLFHDKPEMRLGLFFTGISPNGGASNIWTFLLDGNLNLSITITTLCLIAAFGTIPLWIFILGKQIFEQGELKIPYSKIFLFAVGLIIPLLIGYIIQKKLPKLCKILVRIMKPFSAVLIMFIVIFATVTNLYLLKLLSLQIILAGMGLPWLGYILGSLTAFILRQPLPDVKAIAIETGIKNTGVAIFLLRFSLDPPAGDLTTVVPVSVATMTPIPLVILYLLKLVFYQKTSSYNMQNCEKPGPDM